MKQVLWSAMVVVVGACVTPSASVTKVEPAPKPPVVEAPKPPYHPEKPALRLPADIAPTSYAIAAHVTPSAKTMAVVTTIELTLARPTDRLWLNQTELTFGAVRATFQGKPVAATAKPEAEDFVAIDLATPIGPGAATLVIESEAQLSRREAQGAFVGNEYGDDYVFTQFESIGARRAWPVFDEPSFKVPWQLTLTVPRGLVAVSNTSPEAEKVDGEFKTVTFARTRPMPSYLVAFGVGPFEFVDGGTGGKHKVPVRIVVPKGQAARAKWAAEVTGQVIDHLETYFGTPFPFEKADMLVVVGHFGGAMENPGLVTWNEGLALADVNGETVFHKRGYLSVAAHELAHQWFGDLVTAAWWDDIWLNESFADYVENVVVTGWKPEWGGAIERVEARDNVMGLDSLGSVRRIREPIATKDDIENAFDGITYSKGASVLHMFEHWLGPDVFVRGVRRYLEQHAWKNGTVGDFLSAMNEAAGKDVSGPFNTFLEQPGFPVVTAELHCEPNAPVTVSLSQQRYAAVGSKLEPLTWRFPVCVRWDGGRQCTLLEGPSATMTLETKTCPAWLLANEAMAGYYRVRPVAAALVSNPALAMEERVGAMGDLSALVQTGEASIADELATVEARFKSGNRQLMQSALGSAAELKEMLPAASRPKLAAFVLHHFRAKAEEYTFAAKKGEPEDDVLLRPWLMRVVGGAGDDQPLQAHAGTLTRAWLKNHDSVSPELVGVALTLSARKNDRALFDAELAAAKTEKDRRDRRRLYSALGSVTDPALAKRALELVLAKDLDVRETSTIMHSLAGRDETRRLAFDFVKAHYDELAKRLPVEWESGLISVGSSGCTKELRDEVKTFFEPRTTKALGGPREFANTIEAMDLCIAWRARQVPEAVKFFDHWKK
jgi:alanyl aminopeptidase